MTPAPQGAGVCVYSDRKSDWKEVIEMTDDEPGTTRVLYYVNDSITLETEGSGPEGRSPRDAGNKEQKNV